MSRRTGFDARLLAYVIGFAVAVLVGNIVRGQFASASTGLLAGATAGAATGCIIGLIVWALFFR